MENEIFKKMLKVRAFNLARKTMTLSDRFPKKRSAWIISDQLLRAATSIGANIIESQAASSRKEFANFLNYALKSGNETKFWLALAKELDTGLLVEINAMLKETDELTKILGSSISTIRGKRNF